jgi:hypothetical protein
MINIGRMASQDEHPGEHRLPKRLFPRLLIPELGIRCGET